MCSVRARSSSLPFSLRCLIRPSRCPPVTAREGSAPEPLIRKFSNDDDDDDDDDDDGDDDDDDDDDNDGLNFFQGETIVPGKTKFWPGTKRKEGRKTEKRGEGGRRKKREREKRKKERRQEEREVRRVEE